MSYCRWSSDDYQCDVYVYKDVCGGWTTHVAGSRYVFKEPLPPKVPPTDTAAYVKRYEEISQMIDSADLVDIGLPHDGESFNSGSAGECADLLERLRGIGYNVPQRAIDALREESAEVEEPGNG